MIREIDYDQDSIRGDSVVGTGTLPGIDHEAADDSIQRDGPQQENSDTSGCKAVTPAIAAKNVPPTNDHESTR